jgi:hypothetical protein
VFAELFRMQANKKQQKGRSVITWIFCHWQGPPHFDCPGGPHNCKSGHELPCICWTRTRIEFPWHVSLQTSEPTSIKIDSLLTVLQQGDTGARALSWTWCKERLKILHRVPSSALILRCVKFEVFMAVVWDVTSYCLVDIYQRFGGICCLHPHWRIYFYREDGGSRFVWNLDIHL